MPATDAVEVQVYSTLEGPQLVGCVEFVSPSNKDRPAERGAFATKCAAYLHEGIGLAVVDVVTTRAANLHAAVLHRLSPDAAPNRQAGIYAAAYRPVPAKGKTEVQLWEEELAVGRPLPTIPLWRKTGQCLPLELEATYGRTCRELRLGSGKE